MEYSTARMPTIEAFFASNAFIRGLRGPFGCLPGDAEFLTPGGWKRMDAYVEGDYVTQWHPYGFETEYVYPECYINAPSDKLILFDSGSLVMALSPEHRVPYFNYTNRFMVGTAADLANGAMQKVIPTWFRAPGSGISLSDDMIRFAVMMQADGYYAPHGHQANITVRKERKKERVRWLLSRLGVPYDERVYDRRPTETIFVFYPPYRGKFFGPEWYSATEEQLRIVLDEMSNWDGLYNGAQIVYTSASKSNADFMQFAAHATGRRAAINSHTPENDNHNISYNVCVRYSDNTKNKAAISRHTKISHVSAPNGRQYCFTVPTGFFVARYHDTVFITGNSGKSSACVMELGQRGVAQKPGPDGVRRSRWVVVRNSYRQLTDTTIKTFLQWFPPYKFGDWFPSKHEYTIRALRAPGDDRAAEIEVLFRALDRPDQAANLLSLEVTGAWVNEAREIEWAIVQALEGRVGRYPRRQDGGGATWSGIFMDTNPPDIDSAWFKFFEETDHSERVAELAKIIPGLTVEGYRQIFKQPSGRSAKAENLLNLPQGYYQRLAIGKDPEWIKVYIDGEYGFVVEGKPVWAGYNDTLHCPADPKKHPNPIIGLPILRSYDFGLTPACVFSQVTPKGQWIVFDELVASGMGADRFSDEVLDHSARKYGKFEFEDVGDPAGMQRAQSDERSCFQILHAKGIAIEPALQTLTIRIESVARPLRTLIDGGYPQFVLHPRCKMLRRAMMGGYHFRRMRISGERYSEQPDKGTYSHVADALGYAGTKFFGAGLWTPKAQSAGRGDSDYGIIDSSRSHVTGY